MSDASVTGRFGLGVGSLRDAVRLLTARRAFFLTSYDDWAGMCAAGQLGAAYYAARSMLEHIAEAVEQLRMLEYAEFGPSLRPFMVTPEITERLAFLSSFSPPSLSDVLPWGSDVLELAMQMGFLAAGSADRARDPEVDRAYSKHVGEADRFLASPSMATRNQEVFLRILREPQEA